MLPFPRTPPPPLTRAVSKSASSVRATSVQPREPPSDMPPVAHQAPQQRDAQGAPPTADQIHSWLHMLEPHLEGMIRGTAAKRGWQLSDVLVDELVQDLRLSAWQRDLPRYRPQKGNLKSFIRRRALWMVGDAVRAQARTKVQVTSIEDLSLPAPSTETLLAEASDERALQDLRRRVTSTLVCPLERACVLAKTEGETLQTVALRLSVHPSRASRARKRGLQKLQNAAQPSWWKG